MKDWSLARRSLLKGLGLGAACLPLLRARPVGAQARPTPKHRRLMVIEMTQGLRQPDWKPAEGRLAAQTLPFSSAAFEPVKQDMIFLPDLSNPGITSGGQVAFAFGWRRMPQRLHALDAEWFDDRAHARIIAPGTI